MQTLSEQKRNDISKPCKMIFPDRKDKNINLRRRMKFTYHLQVKITWIMPIRSQDPDVSK